MNPIKSTLVLILSLITTQAFSQYTDVINSNRPGVSRSAFSVGTKVAQFEVGPYIIKEERTPATTYEVSGFGVDFAARYGLLWEELELNVEGNYQNDTKTFTSNLSAEDKRSNFKSLTFGAKYLVYDPYKKSAEEKPNLYSWKANHSFKWKSLIPAVALYAGANFDTPDNPYTAVGIEGFSPKFMIATQNNFPGGWVFIMNFIKDRIGTDQSDFTYILTLTHSFSPQWVIFGEAQGIQSDFYADNLFRFGGAYLWSKDFQLDTGLTFNAKDTPSVLSVNFGMSYRLDFHKDKLIEDDIDNGTSAKDEGDRRANRKGKKKKKKKKGDDPDAIKTKKKQKRKEIDFGNN
ncbi:MAG: transporter [Flavobacteriaceae bacterium]